MYYVLYKNIYNIYNLILYIYIIYIYIYIQGFPYWWDGENPPDQPKIFSFPSSSPNFYFLPRKSQFNPIKKLKRHF